MSGARYLIGDVFERMAELEDGSIDLVLTSPPFLALRSYLPADHPDKAKEIGSEPTPAAFLDTLLALTAEWRRLLAPHGSICVELGDTYAGSGGSGGDYDAGAWREGQPRASGSSKMARVRKPGTQGEAHPYPVLPNPGPKGAGGAWPLSKSLCGIPHLYHLSLAYGRNLLTGQPSPAGQWRIRNVVAWCRPNPPVGALGDKYRPATSYMTIACVSGSRYFDLDAVREPHKDPEHTAKYHANGRQREMHTKADPSSLGSRLGSGNLNPAGAPPLDWWEIPTQPYAGAHYATWPSALCERPIKSMVPQRVCLTCGEPSRRIVEATSYAEERKATGRPLESLGGGHRADRPSSSVMTLGWTDCGHDTWRTGTVLDPFAGSGTTLAVATGHGRDAIGIDLDARNADLARERVGMFLDVDEREAVA